MSLSLIEWGSPLEDGAQALTLPLSVEIYRACEKHEYFQIKEVRSLSDGTGLTEIIVVKAGDGSVGAHNPNGILRKEWLALTVNAEEDPPVGVRALRSEFPVLGHQNYTRSGEPLSLCLYNSTWSEIQRSWTPQKFLARVLWWLRESAENSLHLGDQPLEQLFFNTSFQIILPAKHAQESLNPARRLVLVEAESGSTGVTTYLGYYVDANAATACGMKGVPTLRVNLPPIESSRVERFPATLGDLDQWVAIRGGSFFDELTKAIKQLISVTDLSSNEQRPKCVLILLSVPRLRNGTVDKVDDLAYWVTNSLLHLGEACGLLFYDEYRGSWSPVELIGQTLEKRWKAISILPTQLRYKLDKPLIRSLSCLESADSDFEGLIAGVGALGSSMVETWTRESWGQWTLIDPDQAMPHNLARHIISDSAIGSPKVRAVKSILDQIFPEQPPHMAIDASVVDEDVNVSAALSNASFVVDATTTLHVPRELGERDGTPRTASVFLTPSGRSSVLLLEDRDRGVRISSIEAQYYRAILESLWGELHLDGHSKGEWVGNGCRDISLRLSVELIRLHASLLSRQVRLSQAKSGARACVWDVNDETGGVAAHEIAISESEEARSDGWAVRWDKGFIEQLRSLRSQALPNETGGILLGYTDHQLKTINIVKGMPAPPDSVSTPASFIRGYEGQEEVLLDTRRRTAGIVDYIGDWHSHPPKHSSRPSSDDMNLLASLALTMASDGLPVVMFIIGETDCTVTIGTCSDQL
ncbi:Mov34/MPN/PAD-1 family protein [Pseudomonas sp. DSV-1]|uniref:Mov34/MPN/PAD-1 family protein n=1 Tax=Pseudomonas sp. DSV-1 TaxID=3112250 RepID=UPI002DBBF483|nr:Mov34/MPN/PAD-1 family protein [Pseudomonas sp. DSV-1]MEC4239563.1 Mov34/MPN/PAD-1 family protein [Pseudomonas sp. DSV-1]